MEKDHPKKNHLEEEEPPTHSSKDHTIFIKEQLGQGWPATIGEEGPPLNAMAPQTQPRHCPGPACPTMRPQSSSRSSYLDESIHEPAWEAPGEECSTPLPVKHNNETHPDPSPCRIPNPEGATQKEDPPYWAPRQGLELGPAIRNCFTWLRTVLSFIFPTCIGSETNNLRDKDWHVETQPGLLEPPSPRLKIYRENGPTQG